MSAHLGAGTLVSSTDSIPLGGTAHEYMPDPDGMHGLTKRKQKEMEAYVRQISNMSQSPVQFIYVMVPNVDDRQRGG